MINKTKEELIEIIYGLQEQINDLEEVKDKWKIIAQSERDVDGYCYAISRYGHPEGDAP